MRVGAGRFALASRLRLSRLALPSATTFHRAGRGIWQYQRCRQQIAVTVGTIFDSTKLALTVWFLARHLLTQAKNNVSALELRRQLGVGWRSA